MSIATIEVQPRVAKAEFTEDKLAVSIEDGRSHACATSMVPTPSVCDKNGAKRLAHI